jgi:excinuclease ABC subunit C
MKSQQISKIIKKLPDAPGVYFFRRAKNILYIGKATSLRDRVRSYFSADIAETRGPLISKMLADFDDISFQQTDSVLEALILEANLIKKHQPPANIKEKDNRSFNFVVITDEAFPRVLVVRGRELENSPKETPLGFQRSFLWGIGRVKYKFGPFPNGAQLKEAMKIVRRLFPFRDKCEPYDEQIKKITPSKNTSRDAEFFNHAKSVGKIRACFNRQLGLCPGVCTGEISAKEYGETIKNIILFFESEKKSLTRNLQKQMKDFAKRREFEKAGKIKKTLFTLNHIQDISLLKENQTKNSGEKFRIESYDIAHLSGQNMVGVMTVVENGEARPSEYRKFKIRENTGANDTKALSEILSRRLSHIEWPSADLIVVDGGVAQKNVMEKILRENSAQIPVVSVVKDEHHRPKQILGDKKWLTREREILLSNAEAHRFAIGYHKKLRNKF